MIKINEEYFILPQATNHLRHDCQDTPSLKWSSESWKGAICEGHCIYCEKKVDKKILFIFNLWRLNNE